MARSAAWDEARALYPSWKFDAKDWVEFFDARPDVLAQMLGSIYRAGQIEKQRREGTFTGQKGGRRPPTVNGSLDELWGMLSPRYSMDPFPVAFRELLGQMPVAAFAQQVQMDRRRLWDFMQGRRKMTRQDYERIAAGAGVSPAFFVEWRVLKVQDVLVETLTAKPELSVAVIKMMETA